MKKIICLLSITFLMLQACSSSDSNTTNNPLLKGKLKRTHTVSSNGQNSYSSNYFYDDNGHLIKMTAGNDSGSQIFESFVFTRNSSGKIVNILYNDYNAHQQIDYAYTLDSNQNYLTCSKTYTPSTNNSTGEVYVYSGNKISQINHSDGEKVKYTYDSNENVIKVDKSNGNSSWVTYANYTYDNKVNPFQLEGLIVGRFNNCGNNNITSETTVNEPINYTNIWQYNYNSNNKPSTCISSGTTPSRSTEYFYY